MADLPAWSAVGISAAALGITIAQWVESRIWRRNQQKLVDQIAKEQAVIEARQAVNEIVTAWHNTMISQPMAVFDSHLPTLVERARRWRDDVSPHQARLLAHTGGVKTFAYRLVQDNVNAVMQFGSEVEATMDEKLDFPEEREKVQRSVTAMQAKANPAMHDLDNLRGEELLRPG